MMKGIARAVQAAAKKATDRGNLSSSPGSGSGSASTYAPSGMGGSTPPSTGGSAPSGMTNVPGRIAQVVGRAMRGRRFAEGGSVGSASKRADGCAIRGKTKGRIV